MKPIKNGSFLRDSTFEETVPFKMFHWTLFYLTSSFIIIYTKLHLAYFVCVFWLYPNGSIISSFEFAFYKFLWIYEWLFWICWVFRFAVFELARDCSRSISYWIRTDLCENLEFLQIIDQLGLQFYCISKLRKNVVILLRIYCILYRNGILNLN